MEVQIGPVVLIHESARSPRAGDRFRIAVFVADKAMGTAVVSFEQWAQYCQASLVMRSGPSHAVETANGLPLVGASKFRVKLYGDLPVTDEVDVSVPEGWFEGKTDAAVEDEVIAYVTQLLNEKGVTVRWKPVVPDDVEGDEPFINGVEIDKIEIAVDAVKSVCSRCNDTHRMELNERIVMCTKCPTPCKACRAGGNGAYCGATPCACECHRRAA